MAFQKKFSFSSLPSYPPDDSQSTVRDWIKTEILFGEYKEEEDAMLCNLHYPLCCSLNHTEPSAMENTRKPIENMHKHVAHTTCLTGYHPASIPPVPVPQKP